MSYTSILGKKIFSCMALGRTIYTGCQGQLQVEGLPVQQHENT